MIKKISIIGLILIGFLINCASAKVITSKPGEGGTIAVTKGMSGEEAQQNAKNMMASNCGSKKVKVVKEGEVVVGTQTDVKQDTNFNANSQNKSLTKATTSGNVSTTQTATTKNITEWQIEYVCQ